VGAVRTRASRPAFRCVASARAGRGFTLIELLVVLAMFGLLLGIAALSARPDVNARVKRDAERLQALFTLAAEEAELRARPLAWQASGQGYVFLQAGREGWSVLATDDEFRSRSWEAGTVRIALVPAQLPTTRRGDRPQGWIEFPRDGSQPPFELRLQAADAEPGTPGAWIVRGTGRGTYLVEGPQ